MRDENANLDVASEKMKPVVPKKMSFLSRLKVVC